MMRDFDLVQLGSDVPDPYHGGESDFQNVFDILDRSLDRFINHVLKEHKIKVPKEKRKK